MFPHSSSLVLLCAIGYSSLGLSTLWWLGPPAQAQIVPDTTLGDETTVVDSQSSATTIEGGAIRGDNLFHSFQEFNIQEGQRVDFRNPDGVNRILSRVTGRNPSDILGTLGVEGNADFFLINPHGILFGPNARLAIGGSFLASTGDRIRFEDYEFSASRPAAPPLLRLSTPIGLQMGRTPGPIEVLGPGMVQANVPTSGLTVAPGETLALIGGPVTLRGGILTAPAGQLELGSLTQGEVQFLQADDGLQLRYQPLEQFDEQLGTIQLLNRSLLLNDAIVNNSLNRIRIVGGEVLIDHQSDLVTTTSGPFDGGAIDIRTRRLILNNGGQIATYVQPGATGNGGEITVEATDAVTVLGETQPSPERLSGLLTDTRGSGASEDIQIHAARLLLRRGGAIRTFTNGTGQGGSVDVRAFRSIVGAGIAQSRPAFGSNIATQSRAEGDGGNLTVVTPRLILAGGFRLGAFNWSIGQGGDITVRADSIAARGVNAHLPQAMSGIVALVFGGGDGGDMHITTRRLHVSDGANITSTVLSNRVDVAAAVAFNDWVDRNDAGKGNAGDVYIRADEILLDGTNDLIPDNPSQISSITLGSGDAGNVSVSTRQLQVIDGAALISSSLPSFSSLGMPLANSGTGDGGDLRVDAATIEVQGVNPFLTLGSLLGTQTLGFGDGGQTTIQTETLRVLDGGTVTSGTAAAGNAGQLVIRADDLIQVEGRGDNGLRSSIGSYASAADITLQRAFFLPRLPTGDTGGLEIQTDRLNVLDGGLVSVQHQGPGNAGQMRVQADTIRLEGGALTAETASGQGGDIQLQVADRLQLVQQSRITAEARGNGDGGNLDIEAGLITATPSENNDMIANATSGAGGQIRIRTQGLLGLTYREQLTPDNDITASSQFGIDGTVTITTLTDPAQRATELSETPADSEPPTVATCGSADTAPLALVGRGGLPVDPRQVLPGQVMVQDLRSSPDRPSVSTPETVSPSNPVTPSPVIEEAQGWQVNAAGQVELTAGRSEDLLPFIACQSIAP